MNDKPQETPRTDEKANQCAKMQSADDAYWAMVEHAATLETETRLLLAERNANRHTIAELTEALEAIQARIDGEWDHPSLVKFGQLSIASWYDIERIIRTSLARAKETQS